MHPFAFERPIVVQHHTVQPQDDHRQLLGAKRGDEPAAQHPAKLRQMMLAKGHEKPLHRMGGEHLDGLGLNHRGVAGVALQMIKMKQMPPGAVEEKADQLLEHLLYGLTLAAFAQPREAGGDLLQPPPCRRNRSTKLNPPRLLMVSSGG
jgi:hypothetical protein